MEQIIYLKDLEKTNSITQTAERFFISQQALSYSLKKLEEEFETEFIKRTSHGVVLTADGKEFLIYAEDLLKAYDKLNFQFLNREKKQNKEFDGVVKIACLSRLLDAFMIDIIEKTNVRYPNMKMVVLEKSRSAIMKTLAAGETDLGVLLISDRIAEQFFDQLIEKKYPNTIERVRIYKDTQVICLKKDNVMFDGETFDDSLYLRYPFCSFNALVDKEFRELQSSEGGDFPLEYLISHSQFFSDNISFHKKLIKKGLAISVITSFEFRKNYSHHTYLTAIPFNWDMSVSYYLCYNKNRIFTEETKKLYDLILNYDFTSDS